MNTTQEKNSTAKTKTPKGAGTALSVGLSSLDEDLPAMIERVFQENFNSDDMINVDDHVNMLREFIVKNNMKIQSLEDLLVAAWKLRNSPDRMCDWSQISEGLNVDYGQKLVSLFGSKWCQFKSVLIQTEKDSVKIELMCLEDVEYLAVFLSRQLKKYESENSGAKHWSLEKEWHYNHDKLELSSGTLKPDGHSMFDFIDIGCWKH